MAGAIGIVSTVFVDPVLFGTRLIAHSPLGELLGYTCPADFSIEKVVTKDRGRLDAASISVVQNCVGLQ